MLKTQTYYWSGPVLRIYLSMLQLFSQCSCTASDLDRTRTRTPAPFKLIFLLILPPCRAARLANLSATHNCPQPAAIQTGPLRQPAFCLTGMMQSYVIQFESLSVAGRDPCPQRQPAFCVAGTLRDVRKAVVHMLPHSLNHIFPKQLCRTRFCPTPHANPHPLKNPRQTRGHCTWNLMKIRKNIRGILKISDRQQDLLSTESPSPRNSKLFSASCATTSFLETILHGVVTQFVNFPSKNLMQKGSPKE